MKPVSPTRIKRTVRPALRLNRAMQARFKLSPLSYTYFWSGGLPSRRNLARTDRLTFWP